ncbi:MAG: TfoX/Sxy family protein [Deltaproteobacteria bacterium]|nr:TfoX/Sxy family protein [Deltaproteobacteria bacterium]MBW2253923.1 TfoX/Sxy family protein [Deltaproteobacteria bacterium]
MVWEKSSPTLVALFEEICPDTPTEARKMFSYPCGYLGGNMFVGTFQEALWVRLDDASRAELLAIPGAKPFEPIPGRPMKEYVVVPEAWHEDLPTLRKWVERARAYAATLPVRARKHKKKKG